MKSVKDSRFHSRPVMHGHTRSSGPVVLDAIVIEHYRMENRKLKKTGTLSITTFRQIA